MAVYCDDSAKSHGINGSKCLVARVAPRAAEKVVRVVLRSVLRVVLSSSRSSAEIILLIIFKVINNIIKRGDGKSGDKVVSGNVPM